MLTDSVAQKAFLPENEILERKSLEAGLRECEKRLRMAETIARLGHWRLDLGTREVVLSEEIYRICGVSAGPSVPSVACLSELVHPEDREGVGLALQALMRERTGSIEFRIIRPDGALCYVAGKGEVIRDGADQATALFGTLQDVTAMHAEREIRVLNSELEQRVHQRTLQLEAAYREQESFTYSVSHDLRAPLRHINSFSAILQEECYDDLPAKAREYLDRICAASSQMGRLIDDLLELSRVSRSNTQLTAIDVTKLAKDAVTMLQATQPSRTVDVNIAEGLTATADYNLMKIVLQNLIGNAWKYTSKKRRAFIEVDKIPLVKEIGFFVRDNGVGFDMSYVGVLFGPFQRLHGSEFEGNGIGLATVQRIINRHGGTVWADAEVGRGATFYITLPEAWK